MSVAAPLERRTARLAPQRTQVASGRPDTHKRASAGKARLRRPLRWLHATLGLLVGGYLLIAAATGCLLMFRDELVALSLPDLPQAADPLTHAQWLLLRLEPGSFTAIELPDEPLRAFTVHLAEGGTALYHPVTLAPLPDTAGLRGALDWAFDLHHHLLAGETGEIVSGAFGVATVILVLLGLYLWWPWRRSWRVSHARVRRPTRTARRLGHATLGILIAPGLLLAALTGAGLVFHEPTRAALGGLFGTAPGEVAPTPGAGTLGEVTRAQFAEAMPRMLIPSGEPDGPLTLRLRQPAEEHPNGRTRLVYDPAMGRVTQAVSEPATGTGSRLFNLLYPIHIGAVGGWPMRLLLFASGLLTLVSIGYALRARLGRNSARMRPGLDPARAEAAGVPALPRLRPPWRAGLPR